MIVKRFGVDFMSEGGALTLCASEVSDKPHDRGVHAKHHPDGWVITAEVREDYFYWVNDFVAYHKDLGWVAGDFENEVVASSDEAFDSFYANHKPDAWDYHEI